MRKHLIQTGISSLVSHHTRLLHHTLQVLTHHSHARLAHHTWLLAHAWLAHHTWLAWHHTGLAHARLSHHARLTWHHAWLLALHRRHRLSIGSSSALYQPIGLDD